jgi:hypothetical protein
MPHALRLIVILYIAIGVIHSILFDLLISRTSCLTARGLVAIYCNSGMGISHFVVTLAWPLYWLQSNEGHAQYLTGKDRTDFVAGATNNCMRRQNTDEITARLPKLLYEQYCQCFANGLADGDLLDHRLARALFCELLPAAARAQKPLREITRAAIRAAPDRDAFGRAHRTMSSRPCPGCGAARSDAPLIRDRTKLGALDGPGSAMHHFAP